MKTYEGVDAQIHIFLNSALVTGELSASRPGHLTPGERAPTAISTGYEAAWTPTAGLDYVEKGKILDPYRYSNSSP
jgi:hypothetical protein